MSYQTCLGHNEYAGGDGALVFVPGETDSPKRPDGAMSAIIAGDRAGINPACSKLEIREENQSNPGGKMGSDAKSSILVCVSCGEEFVFTAAAREYFLSLGYTGQPLRCKSCYKKHKHEKKSAEIKLRVLPSEAGGLHSRA